MSTRIRKAVIPAAGLGTRFLPVTKTIPKEMLAIVDKPILLYVVEEAVQAGIRDIILIQGRGKGAIEDFFDRSVELESALEKTGKLDLLESIRRLRTMANIVSVRQKEALGLGHAVLTAESIIGDEPFAVMLGDEIMITPPEEAAGIGQLIALHEKHMTSVVAMMEVASSEVSKYGIVSGKQKSPGLWQVDNLVEKPEPSQAPSRMALPGRYVFSPSIFKHLKNSTPGKSGELQLTDAMAGLAKQEGMLAAEIKARRYDAGDRFGYIQANLELALARPDLRERLLPYLRELNERLNKNIL